MIKVKIKSGNSVWVMPERQTIFINTDIGPLIYKSEIEDHDVTRLGETFRSLKNKTIIISSNGEMIDDKIRVGGNIYTHYRNR